MTDRPMKPRRRLRGPCQIPADVPRTEILGKPNEQQHALADCRCRPCRPHSACSRAQLTDRQSKVGAKNRQVADLHADADLFCGRPQPSIWKLVMNYKAPDQDQIGGAQCRLALFDAGLAPSSASAPARAPLAVFAAFLAGSSTRPSGRWSSLRRATAKAPILVHARCVCSSPSSASG